MPSISHAEALSLINHYGSLGKAASALGVSKSTLQKLAGLQPSSVKTNAKTVAAISNAVAGLPAKERKNVELWTQFFSQASPNMIAKFESLSERKKSEHKKFFEDLYKEWKRTRRDVPESRLQYFIWKAIMRKTYEEKAG